ncbi:MAG: two-component regulator propeller domain-containing protein [Bacteroidia bacterium]
MRILIFIFLSATSLWLPAQSLPGAWKPYLSHGNATASVVRGNILYAITQGGMFSYDIETKETQVFSTVDGLSGISPTVISYDAKADLIFIGYNTGMIDYFQTPNDIRQLNEIERNTTFIAKRINQLVTNGDNLYVGTDFGVVVYDIPRKLPLTDVSQIGTNPTRQPIVSMDVFNNRIFVVVEGAGLFSASLEASNLKDPTVWQAEGGLNGLMIDADVVEVAANSSQIFILLEGQVWQKDLTGDWVLVPDFADNYLHIFVTEDALAAMEIVSTRVQYFGSFRYTPFIPGNVRHVSFSEERGLMYFSTAIQGIVEFNNFETELIDPGGPKLNEAIQLTAGNGELYVAPRGYNQAFTPDPSAAGVFYYNRETGWRNLDSASQTLPKEVSTGFARAFYDDETGNAYMGSFGRGIVRLEKGDWQEYYDCTNSGISIITDPCSQDRLDNSRISGMDKDIFGNLWVTLDFARNPLVVQTPTGEWYQMPNLRFPNNHHIIGMAVDEYGNKWMLNAEQGLLVYNDGNTPSDFDDDRLVQLKAGLNQGGLPSNEVTSIAVDRDGFVWVGTGQGVTVYFDPFSVGQGQVVDASPPIFDGRALLKDAIINGIDVDGGNRKWIATNEGVFLVTEDGDDVIYQFTTDNSPLLDNEVNDISIDQSTGEVFMATARGIISFQGDATVGVDQCEDILVFPNPVLPDFDGSVTIRGSGAESIVKITTVSGLLVREIEAQGGTAVWDRRDIYGNEVRSGVYLALIATRNGENACVGKFTVIGR